MEIEFIEVNYKNLLKNINLKIKSNEITSVVGKAGSGKSLLLNIILGNNLNFDGQIVIDGQSLNDKKIESIRQDIFYLQQNYNNQLFNINVLEDIKYGVSDFDKDKLNELLINFNLDSEILKKNYFELSSGEIKKILIISMFISNKKIILLDDPTNGLDQKSITNLVKLLKKEKRNGKTIIICSPNSDFLLSLSDKIIAINNKEVIEFDNKYDFFSNKKTMDKSGLNIPNVLKFRELALNKKNIKLIYRDNINDLIKDIYRYAK